MTDGGDGGAPDDERRKGGRGDTDTRRGPDERRAPCLRVPLERGEDVRQRLIESGALDRDLEPFVAEGALVLPLADPDAVPGDVAVDGDGNGEGAVGVERGEAVFAVREGPESAADRLGYDPTFDVVGRTALVRDEEDPEEVAEALLASDEAVDGVYAVASPVEGRERTRELEHVGGEEGTEAVHREYGHEFAVDLEDVYFSPRLGTERDRVASQVDAEGGPRGEGERVFDMFAGVGPFAVPMASRGATVIACDVNPDAVRYLRANAERNGVGERVHPVLADARDVAACLGRAERWPGESGGEDAPDGGPPGVDRIVMNLPHSADAFLDAAMAAARDGCVVHYYDIRHEDDRFEGAEELVRETAEEAGFDAEVLERREVRSYAPHEVNVVLDVRLNRR